MRCPACGAFYEERSARCPECGAIQNENPTESFEPIPTENPVIVAETVPAETTQKRAASRKGSRSLIEFPGANRSTLPEWRKELGERVREVQERRAREAVLANGTEPLFCELETRSTPMLELLPHAEAPPLNPLVAAALRRIERARSEPLGKSSIATALAYEEQPEPAFERQTAEFPAEPAEVPKPERVHNLAVVPTPPPIIVELPTPPAIVVELPTPPPIVVELPQEPRKARRVIDEHNPALNYLDSIPTSITVDICKYRSAPVYLRIFGSVVDLIVVALLSAPFLALTQLTSLEWSDPRVIGFAAGTILCIGFLYLTVSTAFTGRTLGMKLFGLRAVDTRTDLIPTGSQSAGRAFLYLLSLASAGILLMYALVDSDGHAVHDRFTRTAVVRV